MPDATPPAPGRGFRDRRFDLSGIVRVLASPVAGALALVTLALFLLTAALHVGVDRSAWHINLPRSFRAGILANELMLSAPWFLALALLTLAGRLAPRRWRMVARSALALLSFAWLSSWAVFWMTGRFVDQEAMALTLASPGPMLLHALQFAPLAFIALPVCAAATTMGLLALVRIGAALTPAARGILVALTVLASFQSTRMAMDSSALLEGNEVRMAHPEGGSTTLGDLFRALRDERTGPVSYLYASLGRPSLESQMDPTVPVVWPDREPYEAAPPAQPRNVIVLIVESLRSDELRAWGSKLAVMPAVDRVADEAVVFLDHQAVATHSNYSSVAPVSGQYPLRHENLHIFPENPGYPRVHLYDVLKPLGYRTAIISSQNERWGGMANFLASPNLDHFFHSETYDGPKYILQEDAGFARYTMRYNRAGKIDDRLTIDEAVRWIGTGDEPPFFVYINLQNSHVPYPVPAGAPTPFGPWKTSFPIRFNYFPADSVETVRGVYRNALHYVDAQVGRLVAHLRATNQLDRTILMIMGDHGQAFLEHGFGAHGNQLYEELVRTPLIIRAPGLMPQRRLGMAQHVDVAPTVLGLLGLPPHPAFQGIDLFRSQRAFAYSVVQTTLANQYGIMTGRHKLVVDGRTGVAVLRDLALDPRERFDFAARDTLTASLLRHRVDTWRAAQLQYYHNPAMQAMGYAPVLPPPKEWLERSARTSR